jgi:tRNA-Thr(GGU) m(6)t(6)A37 methyltransferase TsaA
MDRIELKPIGILRTPFESPGNMPIQPCYPGAAKGTALVFPEYSDGLYDLDGFSNIILVYFLHRVKRQELIVTPFLDNTSHGVFATRAPVRPNPVGISILKLERIESNILYLTGMDMLNGTPLLDIKPYIPDFDSWPDALSGWYDKTAAEKKVKISDNRFTNGSK